jgi:hypothetical protein
MTNDCRLPIADLGAVRGVNSVFMEFCLQTNAGLQMNVRPHLNPLPKERTYLARLWFVRDYATNPAVGTLQNAVTMPPSPGGEGRDEGEQQSISAGSAQVASRAEQWNEMLD